jgi:hypothetical protein
MNVRETRAGLLEDLAVEQNARDAAAGLSAIPRIAVESHSGVFVLERRTNAIL